LATCLHEAITFLWTQFDCLETKQHRSVVAAATRSVHGTRRPRCVVGLYVIDVCVEPLRPL